LRNKTYSYGKQLIDEEDIQAVVNALRSDYLTQGPRIEEFEAALCKRFGCKEAVVVSNATAGLHLLGLALGWGPGDIVVSTPNTFVASSNCVLYAGATPDFVDIDPVTYNLSPSLLEQKLELYESRGQRVKAVVAVDYAGHPCDWTALQDLAKRFKFQLVDDACHALGARWNGIEVCSAQFSVASILSFHPVKHMTTGEGGAVVTNSRGIAEKIRRLRAHGITRDAAILQQNDGPWYYEMQELGFNYRLTDMQCALGISQLRKLDRFLGERKQIAEYYNRNLKPLESEGLVTLPRVVDEAEHAYHLYPVQVQFEKLGRSRTQIFAELKELGVYPQVHYIPVHLQPYYRKHFGFKPGDFPVAESFYQNELSLPMYPGLSDADLAEIVSRLKRVLKV
jgi:UDP-4-amino-4,6-dideoxy-N-acetyl-beta-L-altrosamine transaminase